MFTCIVCNERFDDLFEHLFGKKEGLSVFQDQKHKAYHDKIEGNGYDREKCFCGGTIIMSRVGPDSWNTSCLVCDFLYDED